MPVKGSVATGGFALGAATTGGALVKVSPSTLAVTVGVTDPTGVVDVTTVLGGVVAQVGVAAVWVAVADTDADVVTGGAVTVAVALADDVTVTVAVGATNAAARRSESS
ncbi:MAG: hypothetical protein QOJ62_2935 [Actinomycetota bacterium]|jgi:hypothetical protein|nr:hypothetical protein [Actinomycetota bacterium]